MSSTRCASLVLTVAAALLFASCGGDASTEPTTISTIDVSPAIDTLVAIGFTVQLTAVARGPNGNVLAGKTFTWSSSSQTVATVDTSGLVSASGDGSATITATSENVNGAATIVVVQPVAFQPVATVTITPDSVTILRGLTARFSVD